MNLEKRSAKEMTENPDKASLNKVTTAFKNKVSRF